MATGLTSDSSLDFQLVPLDRSAEGSYDRSESWDSVVDLQSESPPPQPWDGALGSLSAMPIRWDPPESRETGVIWLEGDVLMCACPDCRAPMSIRLWLMVADCWNCGTSIELTAEQEREALRLLRQRDSESRPAAGVPPGGAATTAAVESGSVVPPSVPRATPPPGPPALTPPPLPASRQPVLLADGAALPPPISATPPEPDGSQQQRRRVAAAENLARRRFTKRRGPGPWLAGLLRNTPAWLVSLVFHMILLTLLALLTIPNDDGGKYIVLNATVSRELRRPGQEHIPHPAQIVRFDLPVPEKVDLEDAKTREAMVRADQEARELRLVEWVEPLPDLQQVKQQISNPDGPRVGLAARDPRVRVEMIEQEGGTTLTEAAVARGLRWLAQQQQPDGRWRLDGGAKSDSAATSLALLPFLGAGQTHLTGRYREQVAMGLRWMIENQKEDGDLRVSSGGNTGMYAHGQSAIVLCEAFLMTGDEQLRIPAQKSIDFIVAAQYADGGWRYKPNHEASAAERRGDTSVIGWQLMALQSARAARLTVDEVTLELSSHFLDSVQYADGAQYAYQPRNRPTHVMTAEALLCRIYLGWNNEHRALLEGVQWLADHHLPNTREPNVYYWYYATQVFHHVGGPLWEQWNLRMRDVLVDTQEKHGRHAGSWEPRGDHASAGGRIYMTSLAVCSLEIYYRHLPIFRQIKLDSH
jgi:hypothetical protein